MNEQNTAQETAQVQEPAPQEMTLKPRSKKKLLIQIGFILVLAIVLGSIFYLIYTKKHSPTNNSSITKEEKQPSENLPIPTTTKFDSKFATIQEPNINITPKITPYSVKQDLSNIKNLDQFYLSDNIKSLLAKNAFAVSPGYSNEFFQLYEQNRYAYVPNFVTTDSIVHNYHLMFDYLLKRLEEQKLSPELKVLNKSMVDESIGQYELLKGTNWENAAKRNVGFFSVGSKLLDPATDIPAIVANEVEQELTLINNHSEITISPVMNIGTSQDSTVLDKLSEDYTQYIPRGHYDKTDQLRQYFKSMMWYGRLTFRFKNEDEIRSAILITLALNNTNNFNSWNKIYEPINFFVGKSDDINYYQFKDLVEKIYGNNPSITTITNAPDKFAQLVEATKTLEPPQINSMPIFESSLQPDRETEIKGFRFMGQRFTIDAAIFQRLVYREVGDKTKACAQFKPEETGCFSGARCLPMGLDIPAAMGSKEASNILAGIGEDQYACYQENMTKMNSYISSLPVENWTQNLYWGWLYQLRPLLDVKPAGYPSFMLNNAWVRKDLNTFLGSWSELKHDTILYAKQVYAELGAGLPEKKDDRGYVEPDPYVYARLSALLKMTIQGLEQRGLLEQNMKDNLSKLDTLATSLLMISEKELNNEKLSDADYELIRSYGGQLESFWIEVNKDEPQYQEMGQRDFLNENPAAIIADVASDPNGQVLEVGTGRISNIYVVFPIDGELRIAEGGVYSYYEFSWPMNDRLTDKKWREMLTNGQAPKLPSWTETFTAGMQ